MERFFHKFFGFVVMIKHGKASQSSPSLTCLRQARTVAFARQRVEDARNTHVARDE